MKILTQQITENTYNTISGTSMATPHVSGAAALLLSNDNTLTASSLKSKLMDFSDPIGSVAGKVVSGGRLNVYSSLTGSTPTPPPTTTDTFTGTVSTSTKNAIYTFDVTDAGTISATLSWGTSADLDMYLYSPTQDPNGASYLVRAYTTSNPETMSYSASATGTYKIRVNHYSGVSTSFTLSVTYPNIGTVDTIAPTVTINGPTGTVSGSVTVSADITDNVGVTSADYNIDGGTWSSLANSAGNTWSASLDTTTLSDGTHTLNVRGRDAVGNTGTNSATFDVSNAPPPVGDVTDTFTGTVSSSTPNRIFYFEVGSAGTIDASLSWATTADLDMYLYAPGVDPNGAGWVVRAYTVSNPEVLSYTTTTTGTWAIRVNFYSGSSSSFTLSVTHPSGGSPPPVGTVTDTFTGTVSSSNLNQVFYFDVAATGSIDAVLSWSTTADLDMFLYTPGSDPLGTGYVDSAYSLSNPETISYSATITGTWAIRVNIYSGVSTPFSLSVTYQGLTGASANAISDDSPQIDNVGELKSNLIAVSIGNKL
ncbi:MAG: pre-peptidase C-terminal domain-containing protein [Candidatus Heimdallarchaeota archaeon]|nr:pre-peptidase C-terminal domain-containing protein [Candidatus Heimdallarchaeota archaeon]MDH5647891.1 pre-peptidase C-terminal domain-containing protein [Candidatus Heimdallarchaeota archaeon]